MKRDPSGQIEQAVAILKNGGVAAFPTDTVYGLGAAGDNPAAIRRIFQIKNRPLSEPMPLLLSDLVQTDMVAVDIPGSAWQLMAEFWPGALTLILKKAAWVPDVLTAGSPYVGVRVPDYAITISLIEDVGVPLVGTSANLHGQPAPAAADEVRQQLGDKVDFILDGGRTPVGVESTVVDMTVSPPRIVRQGVLSRAEVEKFWL